MDITNNDTLNIGDVHSLLLSPRNLTLAQFTLFRWFLGIKPSDIIETDSVRAAAVECGIATSGGDAKKLIKGNALSVGSTKVRSITEVLDPESFFETGIEGLLWTSIKKGKKSVAPILIQKLEGDDSFFITAE